MKKIILTILAMLVLVSAANAEIKTYSDTKEKYTRTSVLYDLDVQSTDTELEENYKEFQNSDMSFYINKGKYYTGEFINFAGVPLEVQKCFLDTDTRYVTVRTFYAGTQKSEDIYYRLSDGRFLHYHCDIKNGKTLKKQTIEKADAVDSADGSREGVSTASTRAADVKEDFVWETE